MAQFTLPTLAPSSAYPKSVVAGLNPMVQQRASSGSNRGVPPNNSVSNQAATGAPSDSSSSNQAYAMMASRTVWGNPALWSLALLVVGVILLAHEAHVGR